MIQFTPQRILHVHLETKEAGSTTAAKQATTDQRIESDINSVAGNHRAGQEYSVYIFDQEHYRKFNDC